MKKKIWSAFTLLSISLVLTFSTYKIIQACADYGSFDEWTLTFFTPDLSEGESNFFLYYNKMSPGCDDKEGPNVEEWIKYLNVSGLKDSTVIKLVYGESEGGLDSIRLHKAPQTNRLSSKEVKLLYKIKSTESLNAVLKYIKFSRSIGSLIDPEEYYGWEEEKPIPPNIDRKVSEADSLFKIETQPFLKQRYGFQLLRLLYQAGELDNVIKLYEEKLSTLNQSASISLRIQGYAASAYYYNQRYTTSNLLYADLFSKGYCPSDAVYGFHLEEDQDLEFDDSLSVAQKSSLWFMFGYYRDPLRAMKAMYALNPSNKHLDLLLTRAINIEEQYTVPYNSDGYGRNEFDSALTINALNEFVVNTLQEKKIKRPALWTIAAGHLAFLRGEHERAEKLFSEARLLKLNELEEKQLHLSSALNLIASGNLTTEKERAINKEIVWMEQEASGSNNSAEFNEIRMKASYALTYCYIKLSEQYRAKGDTLKAELCAGQKSNIYLNSWNSYEAIDRGLISNFYQNRLLTEQMAALFLKPNVDPWTRTLLSGYHYSISDIMTWQSMLLLIEGKPVAALTKYQDNHVKFEKEVDGEVFLIKHYDCNDCVFDSSAFNLSFEDYLKDMVRLTSEVNKGINLMENAFKLANGWYNITPYGHAPYTTESTISYDLDHAYLYTDEDEEHDKKMEYIDNRLKLAKRYYAMAFAATNSIEKKAELCWMMAKCELGEFFNGDLSSKLYPDAQFLMGPHAHQLHNQYRNTKYYKEVIRDCTYFQQMVKKKRV